MGVNILKASLAVLAVAGWAVAARPDAAPRAQQRLALLDLVDQADNQPKAEFSEPLRKALAASGKWMVFGSDSVAKRLSDFNLNPNQPCNNPQCSFDIGNILQADYVLYGTVSSLGPVQAVTLKLLNIPTAKIVWTQVTEAGGSTDGERARNLGKVYAAVADELAKAPLSADKPRSRKSLAVIDLSENSLQSRIFFERVCTRIYGSAHYDMMSPSELAELLTALEINKYSIVPSLDNMIGMGQKLGVSNLIYSRLYRDGKSFIYRLAMYDIAGKALVLELPPKPSEDLIKLLDYEKVFFNTLHEKEKEEPKHVALQGGGKTNKALWISLGILGLGGGAAAYWVENLNNPGGSGKPPGAIPLPRKPPENIDR
jgi:hypothetical protein